MWQIVKDFPIPCGEQLTHQSELPGSLIVVVDGGLNPEVRNLLDVKVREGRKLTAQ